MKTYNDCIPCLIRQTIDAVKFATMDEKIHEQVLRHVLLIMSDMDLHESPPVMGQRIHRTIRTLSGNDDPYKKLKDQFNQFALELYPELKKRIINSTNPLETAVRVSIAGNLIDFGASSRVNQSLVKRTIEQSLSAEIFGDIDAVLHAVDLAETILYLGDNAGEIVFDRLLIEELPLNKITFVVRGHPVINDVTLFDAEVTGISSLVDVIDNGSDAPGTLIEECSKEFRERFFGADLIISKGQGNYETLNDIQKKIIFLLKAKCPVIAREIGCQVGDLVIKFR